MCQSCQPANENNHSEPKRIYEITERITILTEKIESFKYDFYNSMLYKFSEAKVFESAEPIELEDYLKRRNNTLKNNNYNIYEIKIKSFDENDLLVKSEYYHKGNKFIEPEPETFKPLDQQVAEISNIVKCDDCDKEIDTIKESEDFREWLVKGNISYCEDCESKYFVCESCDGVHNRDIEYNFQDKLYCEDCYNEEIGNCADCETDFYKDNLKEFDGEYYCRSCLNEKTFTCDDCGDRFYNDDMHSTDDGCYCENCIDNNRRNDSEFESKNVSFKDNTFDKIKSKHKFGIELELDIDDLPFYEIEGNTVFGSKEDGSLDCGMEFYSPILQGDIGYNEIKNLTDIIDGQKPSYKAGFHLHINASEFSAHDLKKIWLVYKIIEKNNIYGILPDTRQNNRFCLPVSIPIDNILGIKTRQELNTLWYSYTNKSGSRYHGFNLDALDRHGTIELRYHSGTSDFHKVINWVKYNFAIVDFACASSITRILSLDKILHSSKKPFAKFQKVNDLLTDDRELKEYLNKRYLKFNPQGKERTFAPTVSTSETSLLIRLANAVEPRPSTVFTDSQAQEIGRQFNTRAQEIGQDENPLPTFGGQSVFASGQPEVIADDVQPETVSE